MKKKEIKKLDYVSYGLFMLFLSIIITIISFVISGTTNLSAIILTLTISSISGFIGGLLTVLIYNKIYSGIIGTLKGEV